MILLVNCASPYIGRSVNITHESVCELGNLPATCEYISKHFLINYEVTPTQNKGEYAITGTAAKHGGITGTYTDYSNATFILLLVDDKVVVESINIPGGQGSFGGLIEFSKTFATENRFQHSLMSYQMDVKG